MITLDTGAETSMIKESVARSLDITIDKFSQQALQADGVTPLTVLGEAQINSLTFDALVVVLDVDILAGTPFLIARNVSRRMPDVSVRQRSLKLEFKTRKLSTTDQATTLVLNHM